MIQWKSNLNLRKLDNLISVKVLKLILKKKVETLVLKNIITASLAEMVQAQEQICLAKLG
jgi:hypothetical protein